MKKLTVVSSADKNRLYFTVAGKITKKDLDSFYTDVRFCVGDLKPGFGIISDFSDCQLVFLNIIPTFRKIMSYLVTNKAGEMVGVMRKNSLFYKQIQLATIFQGYRPIYASSLEKAEEKLTNSIPRNGLRFRLHRKAVEYIVANKAAGKGYLLNISTSGCAIKLASIQPSLDTEIQLTVIFTAQDNTSDEFVIKARVVRVEDSIFAAEFIDLDNTRKEQLWEYLIYESQREIF